MFYIRTKQYNFTNPISIALKFCQSSFLLICKIFIMASRQGFDDGLNFWSQGNRQFFFVFAAFAMVLWMAIRTHSLRTRRMALEESQDRFTVAIATLMLSIVTVIVFRAFMLDAPPVYQSPFAGMDAPGGGGIGSLGGGPSPGTGGAAAALEQSAAAAAAEAAAQVPEPTTTPAPPPVTRTQPQRQQAVKLAKEDVLGFIKFVATETIQKFTDFDSLFLNLAITGVFVAIVILLLLMCTPLTCKKCPIGLQRKSNASSNKPNLDTNFIPKPRAFVVC